MTEGFDFVLDALKYNLNSTYFDDYQKEDIIKYKSKIIIRPIEIIIMNLYLNIELLLSKII